MTAPSDYANLMDEIASCETPSQLKIFRLGTIARRNALPPPWSGAVNGALVHCETAAILAHAAPDDRTLYLIAAVTDEQIGVGTANEVRELIADGILPDSIILMPCPPDSASSEARPFGEIAAGVVADVAIKLSTRHAA